MDHCFRLYLEAAQALGDLVELLGEVADSHRHLWRQNAGHPCWSKNAKHTCKQQALHQQLGLQQHQLFLEA